MMQLQLSYLVRDVQWSPPSCDVRIICIARLKAVTQWNKMAAAPAETSWVIEQCKKRLGKDKHGAKAWLITARLLFPSNFHVQVCRVLVYYSELRGLYIIVYCAYHMQWEVFNVHYHQKDVSEAARTLGELYANE